MFRRYFMMLALLLPFNAFAAGADEARQFVDDTGKKVLAIMNSSGADKQQQLRQTFSENVDMDWMAQFVLGQGWAQATEDQRSRYLSAYREYLLTRYTTNFSDYAGSKYTITGSKPVADDQFVVSMSINAPKADNTQVQAGYRVRSAAGGSPKIIDIIVEGVSLITTQRSEFASVLKNGGIDKLITQLQAKNSEPAQSK